MNDIPTTVSALLCEHVSWTEKTSGLTKGERRQRQTTNLRELTRRCLVDLEATKYTKPELERYRRELVVFLRTALSSRTCAKWKVCKAHTLFRNSAHRIPVWSYGMASIAVAEYEDEWR